MFRTLADRTINIEMISTSEIKISVLVPRDVRQEALRTVHEAFALDKQPPASGTKQQAAESPASPRDAAAVAARLERMEELIIDDITLDATQARLTAKGLRDTPGLAAQLFEEIGAAGINVDMIVQSLGRKGHANITFTMPRDELSKAQQVTGALAQRLGCPAPTSAPEVAKLSIFGIGMRSHTNVAQRVFQSLADAGINVDIISTSEVRLNVVVDASQGEAARAVLEKEFADARL
jgi:aspartate kinase